MLHVLCVLEDNVIMADRGEKTWHVQMMDLPTGAARTAEWSDAELGAVLALSVGGDEVLPDAKPLYEVCEPLFAKLPLVLRSIP
jgi:hypothetical protein